MAIDPTALANLLSLHKPAACAYWKVIWDPNDSAETRYYSDAAYADLTPYQSVGVDIQPKIVLGKDQTVAKNTSYEVNPDLKTETIAITFDNIITLESDPLENIQARFLRFKSGVNCELVFYYPNSGLDINGDIANGDPITESVWFGQLQAPDVYGFKTVKAKATNGARSREQQLPRRPRPRECTSNWGGWMPSEFASETNLCPAGPFGTVASSDLDCPRDSVATCNTKLGTSDGKYYGGFNTDAAATVTSSQGFIAVSKGNTSALDKPIRVIAGTKYIRGLQPLLMRHRTPVVNSWVDVVFEVGEGPVKDIYNISVNDKVIAQNLLDIRKGGRGQAKTGYAANISNFSNTAHFWAQYGWVDLSGGKKYAASDLNAGAIVLGYSNVAIFTDAVTYTRDWTDNRVWWLMELFTNQRFGMAYPETRFEIADWIDVAEWSDNTVSFTALFADGEEVTYSGRRSSFDVALEGRAVAEQLEDICRSGSISIPFQHEGKFTLAKITVASDDEYNNARVFTDTGSGRNIIWGDGQPSLSISQTPDDKVINEVSVTFEESTNTDVARSVTSDDPNQKLKAGRVLGGNNLHPVPKKFAGFGIRTLQEAVRMTYRLLRFGQWDEGGTQNNLKVTFTTPFEQTLGIKRYDLIRVTSSLLDGFTVGTGIWEIEPDLFRVQKMKKTGNGLVEITAQAYNDAAYLDFELTSADGPPTGITCSIDADCAEGFICFLGRCVPIIDPDPCDLTFGADPTYDPVTQLLTVPPPPTC